MRKLLLTISALLILSKNLLAQRPPEIRIDNDPFDFNDPIKLIFILIIPILLLIIGTIVVRRRRKRRSED